MLYRFGPFELDLAKAELREGGQVRPVERQVFALLGLLVENRERLVSRGEIIEKVWDGRVVSEAAIASRVKSARQALSDDGRAQRYIKTLHGQGFRFVADATAIRIEVETPPAPREALSAEPIARPSIAVLPFQLIGEPGPYPAIADALPHDLITELARLRWLFVTARESSFRLRGLGADIREIGRVLGVRYALSGTIEIAGATLNVIVELTDTRNGGLIWANRFTGKVDDVHRLREDIRSRILIELEIQIPLHEAARARQSGTENLDAWSAYHLGLQHMYRFNREDNAAATALFQRAVTQDPGFARAHAGLSFVHFQTAFLRHTDDRPGEIAQARQFAERGLALDPLDPFVNFAMGRTFWLDGDLEGSLAWLDRACTISPNYAQGLYARAWSEALAGRGAEAREQVNLAMRLSPLDPLYYGMLGTRAFTHTVAGEDDEAARWAERAARSPGAHVLIAMVAAAMHEMVGDAARAAAWTANVRARNATLNRDDFFRSFPMKSEPTKARIASALAKLGF